MNGGDEAVDYEGHEVDQSDHDVLVLVHLVLEENPTSNESHHCPHVDTAECGIAPESVVDS